MTGELKSLTTMRGLAAWFVVGYHLRAAALWLPAPLMQVLHKGYLAVDFFFLLSGFVIYLTAHGAFLREGADAAPTFLARRVARIYPLYALVLLGAVAFALVLSVTGRASDGYPWTELPLHILMLQNWGLTGALTWNHPAWSISCEFAAYLVFPALVLWTPIARAGRRALACAITVAILSLSLILALGGQSDLGGSIPRFGLVRCLIEFAAGAMLCAYWLQGPRHEPRAAILTTLGAAGFLTLWATGLALESWAFPAASALLILALAHASGFARNPLHWRPLHYLGEISYATYIAHFMLFIAFKIAFVDQSGIATPTVLAGFIILLFIASALLHRFVEVPGRHWLLPYLRWPGRQTPAGNEA